MMLKEKGLAWEIQKALQMLENPEEGGEKKKTTGFAMFH